MPQEHTYVREAIDELENRTPQSAAFFESHDTFDILVDLIVDERESNHRELRVSEDTYRKKVVEVIEEIADSSDPVGDFCSRLDKIEEEFRDDLEEYRVLFPLNFSYRNVSDFGLPITIRDVEFRRATINSQEEFRQEASNDDDFDEFLDSLPTEENRTSPLAHQCFWEVTYEAGEVKYAISRIESALKILLGEIAFASQTFIDKSSVRNSFWRYGTITLNDPLCFLVMQDGEFSTFYTSTDYTPRKRYSLTGRSQDRFEEVFPELPDFEGELSELEEHLASALKSYYQAISEPDSDTCLQHYWKCLEAITLTQDEQYSAADPLKRARATARPKLDFDINEDRIELLTNKRNSIIHAGGEKNVSEEDNQYLKTLADSSIYFVSTDLDNYRIEEFERLYKLGSKSNESILQAKKERESQIEECKVEIDELESEIESINKITEWLNLDQ